MPKDIQSPEYRELVAIKKLAVLDLIMRGVNQADIAAILEISAGSMSEMFPSGVLGKYRSKEK